MQDYYKIDPQLYDDQFWWKKNDIEFWKTNATSSNCAVLELAAGTGRLAVPLIQEGAIYTGLDISPQYIAYANKKISKLTKHSLMLIQGDMRKFSLNKTYDMIFIGFNSFLHLLSEEDAINCFKSIKKHTHSKTKIYIDIFVPDPIFLYRPKSSRLIVMEFFDSSLGEQCIIKEKLDYNIQDEIMTVYWDYINSNKKCYKEFIFKMKIYYPDTMHRLLLANGFCINNLWGCYQRSKFNKKSALQIYEASPIK